MERKGQTPLKTLEELNHFLCNAPKNWNKGEVIKRFQIYEYDYISCVFWENQHYITGTDIVKVLTYRFTIQGHEIKNVKKFEEGIFSDLRNLKPGIDSSLEEPKSPFLELLYKNKCIRTQKKQKVFFWYSVPYDRLYQDVLKRDKKRELNGKKSTIVIDKSKSPVIRKESCKTPGLSVQKEEKVFKNEMDIKTTACPSIVCTKWVDETQKLSKSNYYGDNVNIKKEECDPQIKKVKKGKKYIIERYFRGPVNNNNNSNLKFICDKKDCNKKFKKLEDLVNHKKFVHGIDKIGYNYSKDFMYVEKNLSFDKNDRNKLNSMPNNNNSNKILPPSIEFDEENNSYSIIIPDNSINSENDESMIISNLSASDITNLSLSDFSLGSISNPNDSMSSLRNSMNLDIKNLASFSFINMNMQNSNKMNNRRDHRLSISSNTTLSNINNSTIFSTSNSNMDLADTSMNTTFLSTQTLNNSSSFILSPIDTSDVSLNSDEQIKNFYARLIKSEETNYSDQPSAVLTPLTTSPNVSQTYSDAMVSQSSYLSGDVSTVSVSSVPPQPLANNYVPINNNIPNVNDVAIPTAHFMAIDSPVQNDGNYLQNVSIPSQGQTQYITTDQYQNNGVQYVPSMIDTSTTTSTNYVSYELSSIINQVTSPPMNVYLTTKENSHSPDPRNYVSSPTALEYQHFNQPQPQPHTPTSPVPSNGEPQPSMFYSLPNESLGQNYLQPQNPYVQIHPQQQQPPQPPHTQQPLSQPMYNVQHENFENMPPMVQMQYQ